MKRMPARGTLAMLIGGLTLAPALLAVLLLGSGKTVQADPGLEVGIDAQPHYVQDNQPTYLNTIEECASESSSGPNFEVDVYIRDVPNLMSFQVAFNYDPAQVHVASYDVTGQFLAAGGGNVLDMSDCPTASGYCLLGAFDTSGNPHTGSGVLARLEIEPQGGGASIEAITLTDVWLFHPDYGYIGDSDEDGYFDGPIMNAEIGLDQPAGYCILDEDGDGVIDALDQCPDTAPSDPVDEIGCSQAQVDPDDDDVCSPGAPPATTWCSGTDNCPEDNNPLQTNTDATDQDGDTSLDEDWPDADHVDADADTLTDEDPPGDDAGDACDPDDDNDGFTDAMEAARGSLPLDPTSTPEVCDGLDNDGDTQVDEGYNHDGVNGPDCDQDGLDTDGDMTANTADEDDDTDGDPDPGFNDGFTDYVENWVATDSLDACADNKDDPAWPVDIDNDEDCDIFDVMKFVPVIMSDLGDVNYDRRFDLDADGDVDIFDVIKFIPHIMTSCS